MTEDEMGKMIVSAWNNGSFNETGAGYGLRIKRKDRDQYFQRDWDKIIITIASDKITIKVSPSFWKKCTELRSSRIGKWFIESGCRRWPKGQPPKYELIHLHNNSFELHELE